MCVNMHVRFEAVPGFYLPRNESAALLSGDTESVYLLNRDEPVHRLARAMTSLTNEWVRDEWLHIGPPIRVEFESVEARLIPECRPVALLADECEARYLLSRDESIDRVCAALTVTVNEYARQEWLHVSAIEGLRGLQGVP